MRGRTMEERQTEVRDDGLTAAQIRRIQVERGQAPCYGSDESYFCREEECPWRLRCRRPRAAWLR